MTADTGIEIEQLRSCFAGRMLTDPQDMQPFLSDWRGQWHGKARAVIQPDSTADVAAVVRWCAARRVPVVPQGGNTGLTGGSVPDASGDAVLLSLARLRSVRAVDPVNNTTTVEAGVKLFEVQQAAAAADRLFPLSLAAEGSCTIGGNLATNAGGTAVLRYGNARDLCLGLEVVTAAGEIWDGLRGLRKDNSGYDLKQLFIGSEGTLGVITAAVMKLFPQPAGRAVAFAALQSPEAGLKLLSDAQRAAGPSLTAFELIAAEALELVLRHIPGTRRPFGAMHPWYALVEISSASGQADAAERMNQSLLEGLGRGGVPDAVIAHTLEQGRSLWTLRETISEAQSIHGGNIKHDVSVPISRIPTFIEETVAALARHFPGCTPVIFGHAGDGNLHFNVAPPPGRSASELTEAVNRLVHDLVIAHGGSISAEHGLGVLRRDAAEAYRSPIATDLLRTIKRALDPLNIMNPGKVLRLPSDP
ncbi:FAD-binding oxidoreductase [Sphingomonas sp.]|uniref:FAD-binding oxidoreductase n=1 Tax=Sphingomonas sp. TaxID=28214 RepID=UPI002DF08205|nr:FAD-binding oxidoreductase [Sphingomonas sp.]